MNFIFDAINKLRGLPTTGEIRESKKRRQYAEMKSSPAPLQKAKPFVPTKNDPEYYAQRGAANEAEAQAQVNAYRESMSPGIKPLYLTSIPTSDQLKKRR